jgi:hypothetical protein
LRVPETYEEGAWRQQEGETVFAPFQQDSEMIGPPEHTWMINFRVDVIVVGGDADARRADSRDGRRAGSPCARNRVRAYGRGLGERDGS